MAVILVVDDLPLVCMLCRRYLEAAGHRVIQAHNGRQAVAAYQLHHPDAVLMDLMMPELDGIGALEQIKKVDPGARIAMLTSEAEVNVVTGALKLGARDYVVKPFRAERLVQAVVRLLEG